MHSIDHQILNKLNSKITKLTLDKLGDLKEALPNLDTRTKGMIWKEILELEKEYGNFDYFVSYLHVHHFKRKKENKS